MLKKVLCMVMAVLMTAVFFAGCGSSAGNEASTGQQTGSAAGSAETSKAGIEVNPTGMPIVNKPLTLKFLAAAGPFNKGDFSQVEIWKAYEQLTGIHVDWEAVPSENVNEKKNIILASGNYPDAFFKISFTSDELTKYGEQGILRPINNLIENYAPNFKKVLDENPDVKKGITMLDGNIYSLPYLVTATPSRFGMKMFVNRKWLDKLGLQPPTTTDELYTVLKAFKQSDPNGNQKADEIPLSSAQQILGILFPLKGAWGLGTRGGNHPLVDVDEATGKLRFIPADPKYKEVLQYISKLYTEKLIDEEIFTITMAKLAAKGAQNQIGFSFSTSNTYVGQEHQDDFVGLPGALKGPNGDQLFAMFTSSLASPATFEMTASNKNPEATMRWIEYFYGDEGIKLYFMGIEGKTYVTGADGKVKYSDEVLKNPNGLTREEVLGKYVVWSGGNNPSIAGDKYFGDHAIPEITRDAGNKLMPFAPKEVWSNFNYSTADADRMKTLTNDMNTYINDMAAKFITGNTSFDKWDEYVNTINKMGLEEFMQIYERGYQQYSKDE